MEITKYENYPFGAVLLSNLVAVSIYGIGAFIIYQLGVVWLILYLLYIAFLEAKLLLHCKGCYYYGKACAFGRGKLSCLFFKKGDPQKFSQRKLTWKNLIPDFLVSIIPAVIGIIILVRDFSWLVLSLLAILFLLTSAGNGFIRGSIACKHCKQLDLGCPATRLFNKKQ